MSLIKMTPKKLQDYIYDYNYEITLEQAIKVLETLEEYCDIGNGFTSGDIQRVTDFIVYGKDSPYAEYYQ